MQQAKSGDTVKVDYTGKLEDGTVFDTSESRGPLQFIIGDGQIIPGFDQAVVGMNVGDKKTINIPSDQAYGPHLEDKILEVNQDQIPKHLNLEVGQQVQVPQKDGSKIFFVVTSVSETSVNLDGNHPLAGKDLVFDIQLVEIV
jgi:FKBP-type peptidyl-prolyl cis-trans isomerase 2